MAERPRCGIRGPHLAHENCPGWQFGPTPSLPSPGIPENAKPKADLGAALDALTGPRPHLKPGPPCSVAVYLDGLLERDAALHARVVAIIDDPGVPGAALARALREDGADLSAYSLRWHRRRGAGGCRCER